MSIVITPAMLKRIAPTASPAIIEHLAPALTARFPERPFDVTTENRAAHFLCHAAHETDGFRTLVEYGDTAYFRRYDGRKDLGNETPGDGPRYRGRGIFQLTGRFNYRIFGNRIRVDLEGNPARAAEPDISVQTALHYWNDRRLNPLADRDDIVATTKKINGGRNGLADRKAKLIRAKAVLQGRPAAQAIHEIRQESAKATTASKRAITGTAAAGGTGLGTGTAAPKPAAGFDYGLAAVIVITVAAMGFLGVRAWMKSRDAKAFAADAALGSGE